MKITMKHHYFLRLCVVLLIACLFCAAGRADFNAAPASDKVTTGDDLNVVISCTSADLYPAAAIFHFTIDPIFQLKEVTPGKSLDSGELSYNYTGEELILLYLDDDAGGSPIGKDAQLAVITLTALEKGQASPLKMTSIDLSGVDNDGNVVSLDGNLTVGSVTVSGKTVSLPTPDPAKIQSPDLQADPVQPSAAATPSPSSPNVLPSHKEPPVPPQATPAPITGTLPEPSPESSEAPAPSSPEDASSGTPASPAEAPKGAPSPLVWVVLALGGVGIALWIVFRFKNRK